MGGEEAGMVRDVVRACIVIGLMTALAGCASSIQRMNSVQATGGTPFTRALTEEYRGFVATEQGEYDWSDARYFAHKGLAAAKGEMVLPEDVARVPSASADDLTGLVTASSRCSTAVPATAIRKSQLGRSAPSIVGCMRPRRISAMRMWHRAGMNSRRLWEYSKQNRKSRRRRHLNPQPNPQRQRRVPTLSYLTGIGLTSPRQATRFLTMWWQMQPSRRR